MNTTALLLATKILFTGIVGFVPSAKEPGKLIRVVVPNSRIPDEDEISKHITGHVAYFMFRFEDMRPGSRVPDVVFEDPETGTFYGVIWLKSEFLTFDGNFKRDALTIASDSVPGDVPANEHEGMSLRWLYDTANAEATPPVLNRRLLTKAPDPSKVTLRTNLRYGAFAVEPGSVDPTTRFVVNDRKECRALTRAVSVTLNQKREDRPATLIVTSESFRGKKNPAPIVLDHRAGAGPLMVLIGNEAIPDVTESIEVFNTNPHPGMMASHYPKEGPQVHVLLANRLLKTGSIRTPNRIPVSECVNGSSSLKGDSGKNGGCSPLLLPAGDPTP